MTVHYSYIAYISYPAAEPHSRQAQVGQNQVNRTVGVEFQQDVLRLPEGITGITDTFCGSKWIQMAGTTVLDYSIKNADMACHMGFNFHPETRSESGQKW